MHKTELSLSEHIKSESITASKSLLNYTTFIEKIKYKKRHREEQSFFYFQSRNFLKKVLRHIPVHIFPF